MSRPRKYDHAMLRVTNVVAGFYLVVMGCVFAAALGGLVYATWKVIW